jgi:hypothetical protein
VVAARILPGKTRIPAAKRACYRVQLSESAFDPHRLEAFLAAGEVVVSRRSGKGSLKKINLTDMILSIELPTLSSARMTLRSEPGRMLRPEAVLEHVFGLAAEEIRKARILKQDTADCRSPKSSIGRGGTLPAR